MDAEHASAKAPLFTRVRARLRELTTSDPEACWWVPGRLEVFGTHTDYAGGRTLVAAVPQGFGVAMVRRNDSRVHVADVARPETFVVDTDVHVPDLIGWRHYVQTVVSRLVHNFPGARLGATIVFESDLPRAAGLSSSSALMISVATALVEAARLRERKDWRSVMVSGLLDEAAYYACVENGRTFRTLQGDAGVGTHGGSEDHAAILMGRAGAVSGFSFVPMQALDTLALPREWAFVVSSSGIRADKTGTAMDKYNRLSEGAAVLLSLWHREGHLEPSLAAALGSSASAQKDLEGLALTSSTAGWTGTELVDRLTHFVSEDGRIPAAMNAVHAADAHGLGRLAAASQDEAQRLLKNQTPETAALARLALDNGGLASRSFGAGFGGSVWALVDRSDASAFTDRWLAAYRRDWPAGRDAVAFVATPGPGLTRCY